MSNISSIHPLRDDVTANPLDIVESLAEDHHWHRQRFGPGEIIVSYPGKWGDYDLYMAWIREKDSFQLACVSNLSFPPSKRTEVESLICLINNRLELGHFGLEAQEKVLSFRHTIFPTGGLRMDHMKDILRIAVHESEKMYPSFQMVIWGGKTPEEALEVVMFETQGQA